MIWVRIDYVKGILARLWKSILIDVCGDIKAYRVAVIDGFKVFVHLCLIFMQRYPVFLVVEF